VFGVNEDSYEGVLEVAYDATPEPIQEVGIGSQSCRADQDSNCPDEHNHHVITSSSSTSSEKQMTSPSSLADDEMGVVETRKQLSQH
jgi:hypothetical protein